MVEYIQTNLAMCQMARDTTSMLITACTVTKVTLYVTMSPHMAAANRTSGGEVLTHKIEATRARGVHN